MKNASIEPGSLSTHGLGSKISSLSAAHTPERASHRSESNSLSTMHIESAMVTRHGKVELVQEGVWRLARTGQLGAHSAGLGLGVSLYVGKAENVHKSGRYSSL